jgi:hypothetical protein
MLTILGNDSGKFCDGLTRRSFLQIGGLALGGASLPQFLAAEAAAGKPAKGINHKAVIMIFLPGGPPHQDMWDLKPDAPAEYRGEFRPIKTNVPGIEISEELPRLAKIADKLTFVRSIVGAEGPHDAMMCLTGRPGRTNVPPGGWPSIGSAISKLQGGVNDSCPPFVGLAPKCGHDEWGNPGPAGFLGPSHSPFTPFRGAGKEDIVLKGVSLERLGDRRALLASFDDFRRDVDRSGMMEGLDTFNQQAFGVLTSSTLAKALDITEEDPKLIESYGKGLDAHLDDGSWRRLDQFLMARRLVEAGARCVTLSFSRWDWHSNNFKSARREFPMLDQGLSALVKDLHDRGLDKDVSVIVWGEFGRTPKINPQGRPRSLAARQQRRHRRRRHEPRAGHRRDRPARRRGGGAPRRVPGNLRDPLQIRRHRCQQHRHPRSHGATDLSRRSALFTDEGAHRLTLGGAEGVKGKK